MVTWSLAMSIRLYTSLFGSYSMRHIYVLAFFYGLCFIDSAGARLGSSSRTLPLYI